MCARECLRQATKTAGKLPRFNARASRARGLNGEVMSARPAEFARACPRACRGFTLVELVVVLALVGVVAVVSVSRTTSTGLFTQRAAVDELAALWRQAHKRAIAQRGGVVVTVDTAAGVVRFCRDATPGCPDPLIEVGDAGPMRFQVPADSTLSLSPAAPAQWSIDGLGRIGGATGDYTDLVLDTAAAQASLRVWSQTGYAEVIWSPR